MRKTPVLFKHNISRLTKLQWFVKGNVKVIPTKTEEILKSQGCEVIDVQKFLFPPKKNEEINYIGLYDKKLPKDERHPDYKTEPCYIVGNNNVLIEGLNQAKQLTNTVEICDGLPKTLIEKENSLNLPEDVHIEMIKKIKLSTMFEASQEKLPKRKDPLRPSWVFKREFGIPDVKRKYVYLNKGFVGLSQSLIDSETITKIDLLCKNLSVICEQFSQSVNNKSIISNCFFSTPIEIHNQKIQFEMTNELVVTTKKKLKVLAEPDVTLDFALPEEAPENYTIGLTPFNFYEMENIYSPGSNSKWPYIQTVFLHFNPTQVKSITEEEITESQVKGRALLNGFCVAAAEARAIFGPDVKKLSEPVVVPVVQTDGKMFQFSVFQLNTLDFNKDSPVKNILWSTERIPLYSTCEYQAGRPTFEGYNPDIIKKIICFYNIE